MMRSTSSKALKSRGENDRIRGQMERPVRTILAKVAIPDAEAYEVPRFREELLRAMKERAPKKFDKENKRYEELVK